MNRIHTSPRYVLLAVLACGPMTACTNGSDSPAPSGSGPRSTIEQMMQRSRVCGVVTEGRTPPGALDFEEDCFLRCILSHADCTDLSDFWCTGNTRLDSACDDVCSQDVECADGSTIPLDYMCDGDDDCSFGEDEDGCGAYRFRCEDGSTIRTEDVCDGSDDCGFGEDELNCPAFRCNDGETISESWRCDGNEDCSSGEDELGCAASVCI